MSAESPSYNPLVVKAWSLLAAIVSTLILGMFIFGPHLLRAGRAAWDLIRWLATPII